MVVKNRGSIGAEAVVVKNRWSMKAEQRETAKGVLEEVGRFQVNNSKW